jgi:hypothetical protein
MSGAECREPRQLRGVADADAVLIERRRGHRVQLAGVALGILTHATERADERQVYIAAKEIGRRPGT